MDDLKRELALGYRVMALNGLGIGLLAHLTVREPDSNTFLTYPLGLSVEEVTAADICEVDHDLTVLSGRGPINRTLALHGELYRARPDILCIAHHHGENGVALGALGCGLLPIDRNSARWHGELDVAGDYESLPLFEQGPAMIKAIGSKKALFLKHHGMLVTGSSIADVVVSMVELDKSCGVLLKSMAAGKPGLMGIREIEDAKEILASERYYRNYWAYYMRALKRRGMDDV